MPIFGRNSHSYKFLDIKRGESQFVQLYNTEWIWFFHFKLSKLRLNSWNDATFLRQRHRMNTQYAVCILLIYLQVRQCFWLRAKVSHFDIRSHHINNNRLKFRRIALYSAKSIDMCIKSYLKGLSFKCDVDFQAEFYFRVEFVIIDIIRCRFVVLFVALFLLLSSQRNVHKMIEHEISALTKKSLISCQMSSFKQQAAAQTHSQRMKKLWNRFQNIKAKPNHII